MPILLSCACGKKLRVPDQSAGKKVRCPGCGKVLTATPPLPPEEPEVLEVVEEPEERVEPPRRAGVRPPPPPPLDEEEEEEDRDEEEEERPRKARRRDDVPVVKLTPIGNLDERWSLELDEDEVRLIDDEGDIALDLAAADANTRIQFPSFWASAKYLQFLDELGQPKFQFQPAAKAVKRIRAYLDNLLRRDPRARRTYKQRGVTVMLLGLLALGIGGAALAYLLITGKFQEWRYRGIGLAIAGIGGGLASLVTGLMMYRKAVRMGQELDEEDDS